VNSFIFIEATNLKPVWFMLKKYYIFKKKPLYLQAKYNCMAVKRVSELTLKFIVAVMFLFLSFILHRRNPGVFLKNRTYQAPAEVIFTVKIMNRFTLLEFTHPIFSPLQSSSRTKTKEKKLACSTSSSYIQLL